MVSVTKVSNCNDHFWNLNETCGSQMSGNNLGDTLAQDSTLRAEDHLVSPNGAWRLLLQVCVCVYCCRPC
jgi:hypothetical protein